MEGEVRQGKGEAKGNGKCLMVGVGGEALLDLCLTSSYPSKQSREDVLQCQGWCMSQSMTQGKSAEGGRREREKERKKERERTVDACPHRFRKSDGETSRPHIFRKSDGEPSHKGPCTQAESWGLSAKNHHVKVPAESRGLSAKNRHLKVPAESRGLSAKNRHLKVPAESRGLSA